MHTYGFPGFEKYPQSFTIHNHHAILCNGNENTETKITKQISSKIVSLIVSLSFSVFSNFSRCVSADCRSPPLHYF